MKRAARLLPMVIVFQLLIGCGVENDKGTNQQHSDHSISHSSGTSSSESASSFDANTAVFETDFCHSPSTSSRSRQSTSSKSSQSYSDGSYIPASSSSSYSPRYEQSYGYDCSELPNLPYTPVDDVPLKRLVARNVALTQEGELIIWGRTRAIEPPTDLPPASQVDVGDDFFIVLHTDGSISILRRNDSPVLERTILDVQDAIAIAAGKDHALVLLRDGSIVSWGGNDKGQANIPADLGKVVAISAGSNNSLALLENGQVKQWGDAYNKVPDTLSNIIAIDSQGNNNIAIDAQGRIHTWGNYGALDQILPDGLTQEYGAVAVVAGERHYLAKLMDGTLVGWDRDEYLDLPYSLDAAEIEEFAAGGSYTIARNSHGEMFAWGHYSNFSNFILPSDLTNIQHLASGDYDNLMLKNDLAFNLNGFRARIPNISSGAVKSLQMDSNRFGVLFDDGQVYLNSISGQLDFDSPLLQVPNSPVEEFALSGQANLFLFGDGSLQSQGKEGIISIPELPGPVRNLVGDASILTLDNGELFSWRESALGSGVPYDGKDIVKFINKHFVTAVLNSSGQLTFWTLLWEYYALGGNKENWSVDPKGPMQIADNVRDFDILYDGSVIIATLDGKVEFWKNPENDALPAYSHPPSDLMDVVKVSAVDDNYYALTGSGQVVVWGNDYYFPANLIKLLPH